MPEWAEFYKGRLLSDGYRQYAAQRYAPFLDCIRQNLKRGDRVVEVGCGLATMTALLAENRTQRPWVGFRCFDINQDMVAYARQNLHEGYPVDVGDARLPTHVKPDVVHSHGMLEHFSNDDIRKVIQAHRDDGARIAIHYVPGDKYETPSFGDERLLPVRAWQEIANPSAVLTFNDGYDYAMIWDL